jgi:2-polyprenyl-3-methyl-5-hydroxy-6-metoxy-1,4-benzoquinol methylase
MYIAQRTLRFIQAALKSYGPSSIKRFLWNKEYSGDKWNFADNTLGDCVYSHLEKYAANGSILDLGCGSGNTADEMAVNAYHNYVGVDISETCLSKASMRSKQSGRSDKNQFVSGDFLNYVPSQQFDVILFRESMYHVPMGKIMATVQRYSKYLRNGGVFIVRMGTIDKDGRPQARPKAMIDIIKRECEVVESCQYEKFGAVVIVFRAKRVEQAVR